MDPHIYPKSNGCRFGILPLFYLSIHPSIYSFRAWEGEGGLKIIKDGYVERGCEDEVEKRTKAKIIVSIDISISLSIDLFV